ncbi:uncharacterized protein [Amphiura filiformis]|uniref:uncharacterized protein n=1 Tax=Amphiura filiformis TaxID=82378 RepID=UPI003B2137D1
MCQALECKQCVWQQRHFTQSNASDRSIAKQANLLQFCGDEVVLFEWTEIVRWHITTGERLAPRDCVVAMGAMSKKYLVVINPLITSEKDCTINAKSSDVMYPCLLIGIGNMMFFFTKAGMKSVQLPNFITCLAVWSRTLLIGWNTGAVDLYTLPDDLVTFDRSQLLQKPHHLVPAIFNNWQGGFFPQNTMHATGAVIVGNRAFLIRAPNIEVWDLEKKLFLTSEFYGSSHVRKMVSNGSMIFCLTGSALNWFEWNEDTVELLPGQTPDSAPSNATCIALYGDLLALGTSEGLIYMYHLNWTTMQEDSTDENSESWTMTLHQVLINTPGIQCFHSNACQ